GTIKSRYDGDDRCASDAERDRREGNYHSIPCAEQHSAEQVAPQLVGAKVVFSTWSLQSSRIVSLIIRKWCNHWGRERSQTSQDQQNKSCEAQRFASSKPPKESHTRTDRRYSGRFAGRYVLSLEQRCW